MSSKSDNETRYGRMLDFGGAAVVLSVAIAGIVFVPRWFDASTSPVLGEIDSLGELMADEDRVRTENAEAARELKAAEARLRRAIERIPLAVDESAFLSEVVAGAQRHDVHMGDFETGRVVSTETHDELDMVIEGTCSHGALCRLMSDLSDSPRAGRAVDLTVDLVDPMTRRLTFRLVWRLYAQPAEVAAEAGATAGVVR